MPSFLTTGSLAKTVDDHIAWFIEWHRLAFIELSPRAGQAKKLGTPPSFSDWYKNALNTLPQDQPAVDRLAVLHDQLHTLARLVLMKTPDGTPVGRKDYESVIVKYEELMQGLRRLERAFSVAASGIDLLTGLRSRVGLKEELEREYNRFLRTHKPFCIGVMDIDHFKSINDTHGHDSGDRVLAAVADHISRSMRAFDDAYRLGGEEFLLCIKEAELGDGFKVIERLRQSLERLPIILPNGHGIGITASFGLTVSHDDVAIDELIHRADQALYRAKNQGRNQVVVLDAVS
ncbi:MAG: diguanylate cyclase [Bdellovibrionales bacterium]